MCVLVVGWWGVVVVCRVVRIVTPSEATPGHDSGGEGAGAVEWSRTSSRSEPPARPDPAGRTGSSEGSEKRGQGGYWDLRAAGSSPSSDQLLVVCEQIGSRRGGGVDMTASRWGCCLNFFSSPPSSLILVFGRSRPQSFLLFTKPERYCLRRQNHFSIVSLSLFFWSLHHHAL
ncbi:uncharacterized protein IWZ02DRAFT_187707 [Phyllosticta citriasiana]|uniref:Secreted protein n=1 Tax=Phyllosticta citriasiana TaxID=595635 RepID=A0ABR1KLM6_9PEZI